MTLGDMLGRLGDPAAAEAALLAIGDLTLLAGVGSECERQNETAGEYASGAVRRFANLAGDDDWLRLMTAIENAEDPAAACLASMLRWSVKADREEFAATGASPLRKGCSCGGDGGCDGE